MNVEDRFWGLTEKKPGYKLTAEDVDCLKTIGHQLRHYKAQDVSGAPVPRSTIMKFSAVSEARKLVAEAGFDEEDVAQCILVEKVIELVAMRAGSAE